MTDTIDVAALVERLRAGDKLAKPEDCRRDRCNCDIMDEAATAIQSQADALAEVRREMSDWRNGDLAGVKAHLDAAMTRATTAEASLATMREALEEWRAARLATLAEPVADVRKSETFAKALNRLSESEDGLMRAVGGE